PESSASTSKPSSRAATATSPRPPRSLGCIVRACSANSANSVHANDPHRCGRQEQVMKSFHALTAAVLTLATPAAVAHVSITPQEAAAGSYAKLTFRVPHGCDGSATKAVRITIPEGIV